MRIISGKLKGKKLSSPSNNKIRPTQDRIRESIFDIISSKVKGAIVLDLFAGSGSFGIEAISRGAKKAVFIDLYKNALALVYKNIISCKINHETKIIKWNILKNLSCIK